jgi:hypothetical protein
MDAVAITNASDELLKEMGLSKAGDRLSLKGFCAHQEDESSSQEGNKNRKRALLEAFLSRKKDKNKAKSKSKNSTSSIKEPLKQKLKKVALDGNISRNRSKLTHLCLWSKEGEVE